ncbi:Ig-like domain-containing protein [Harryflintia acetispora]|uniref:Ig-like protein group 2 n=1 Tax=Harryflintia acetispora TaxID=1849041 RepID=A0A9X8UI94_9FIRM|nr:Ig-like domain-containing protein [Harryflintia acetispora]TCL42793.1 Ig-like protein group 2 [Harryflintia acetispora]
MKELVSRRAVCLSLALSLTLGLCLPAGATLGESGGERVSQGAAPRNTPAAALALARGAAASAGPEKIFIPLSSGDSQIASFLVTAKTGDEPPIAGSYDPAKGRAEIPLVPPPQRDTDYEITVTSVSDQPGLRAPATKTVRHTYPAVKSIALSGPAALRAGESATVGAALSPHQDYVSPVRWASGNEAVLSITPGANDRSVTISALKGGTATVTASIYEGADTVTGSMSVTVVPAGGGGSEGSAFWVTPESYTLFTSGTADETAFTVAALFSPGDEATPVSWSTDKTGIVELQEVPGQPNQKRVVAKAPGRATITAATAGGLLSDSCVVTVYQIGDGSGSGEDITVKPPDNPADGSYQYIVNGRLVLYTNGTPNSANLSGSISVTPSPPSPPQPAWASGNPGVAAVDQNGNVRAVAAGETTVTATLAGKTGSIPVTVYTIANGSLSITGAKNLVHDGSPASAALSAVYSGLPSGARPLTSWQSSNNGVLSLSPAAGGSTTAAAQGKGTATVTASGGGQSATANISVGQAVTGITVSAATATVKAGEATTVSAAASPANADNRTINWTSSNPAVATVSPGSSGSGAAVTITGVAVGTATITATAAGNAGLSKTVAVTVLPNAPAPSDLGKMVEWAGRSWWVVDDHGEDFGGNTGSVVLLANFNYTTCAYGSSHVYSSSTARTQCVNFYNSLSAEQKAKLSPNKLDKTYAWLPSFFEIYGNALSSSGTYIDPLSSTKQFSYFAKNGVTNSNYGLLATIYGNAGVNSWLRSYFNITNPLTSKYAPSVVYSNGRLGSSTDLKSIFAIRPCVILNP